MHNAKIAFANAETYRDDVDGYNRYLMMKYNGEEEDINNQEKDRLASTFIDHPAEIDPSITYSTHVAYLDWMEYVSEGETAGDPDKSKQIEAIKIKLENAPTNSGITYTTHVQDLGWLDWVENGASSGTTGKNKRAEAIKIALTGEIADSYDVFYRVYVQDFGWLGWAKNGEPAGSEGLAKAMLAIEINLIKKGEEKPGSTKKPYITKPTVAYKSLVENSDWLDPVTNGKQSGTVGMGKQIEAINIVLADTILSGNIRYRTHVQNIGWLDWVNNGENSGDTEGNRQVEAIQIQLEGEIAEYFDIFYRVHVQDFGWLGWAKNGQKAGTEGLSKQMEAFEIILVEKGGKAPSSTKNPYYTHPSVAYRSHVEYIGWMDTVLDGCISGTTGQAKQLEALEINLISDNFPYSGDIVYRTHVQDYGWLNWVKNGEVSGTVGKYKRVEAVQIKLEGEIAKYYDIYYRVHSQDFGWLGWAKNGMMAGSEGLSKQMEAIEIRLFPKGKGPTVDRNKAYKKPLVVFIDPGHGGSDPGAIGGTHYEKNLNLEVAKKVRELLKQRGIQVYMSRDKDIYVDLYERARMANDLEVDLFISIHHNSTNNKVDDKSGIETYYYIYKPEYPPRINEDKHNDSERLEKSRKLANIVQRKLVEYTGAKDGGIHRRSFAVVRETKMPAILLELGYINNPNERQKLISSTYQNELARAIADAVLEYSRLSP